VAVRIKMTKTRFVSTGLFILFVLFISFFWFFMLGHIAVWFFNSDAPEAAGIAGVITIFFGSIAGWIIFRNIN